MLRGSAKKRNLSSRGATCGFFNPGSSLNETSYVRTRLLYELATSRVDLGLKLLLFIRLDHLLFQ
jgi:hypothetical protein